MSLLPYLSCNSRSFLDKVTNGRYIFCMAGKPIFTSWKSWISVFCLLRILCLVFILLCISYSVFFELPLCRGVLWFQRCPSICPWQIFLGLADQIFLILCMKLRINNGVCVTKPDFLEKPSFWKKSPKMAESNPKSDYLDFSKKIYHYCFAN